MAKIDLGTTSPNEGERGKRWVFIPEKDIFDYPHSGVQINQVKYGPGKHFVDAATADWIEARLNAKYDADLKIMRPNQDVTSTNTMNRYGFGAGRGAFVAPESLG